MNTPVILLSAFAAFAATLSAGIFINRFKERIGLVCAFSAGFFIALSLLHVLPDVLLLLPEAQISAERILLTAVAGFFILFALNYPFLKPRFKSHYVQSVALRRRIGLLSTVEFCSHGFVEGIAMGLSFQFEFGLGVFVAVAVISHDFCDGISTLVLMLNSGNTLNSSMRMLLVDAVAPVLGAVATLVFTIQSYFLALMLSFLAGSFLYIGAGSLLPEAIRMNRPIGTIAFFSLGFLLILFFTTAL